MLCNRYGLPIAARSLGEFQEASEAPVSIAILAERATPNSTKELRPGRLSSKWPAAKARRGSMSFTTCDRDATQAPGHFNSTIGKPFRLHNTRLWARSGCWARSSYRR